MSIHERMVDEIGIAPAADLFATDPATDVISLANYQGVVFTLLVGAGATGTATVTVEECDDATPSNSTAIAFRYRRKDGTAAWGEWTAATASGFATTAGASELYQIKVEADGLSDGFPNVRAVFTEVVDDPVVGGVLATAYGARFGEEVPVTALAS